MVNTTIPTDCSHSAIHSTHSCSHQQGPCLQRLVGLGPGDAGWMCSGQNRNLASSAALHGQLAWERETVGPISPHSTTCLERATVLSTRPSHRPNKHLKPGQGCCNRHPPLWAHCRTGQLAGNGGAMPSVVLLQPRGSLAGVGSSLSN